MFLNRIIISRSSLSSSSSSLLWSSLIKPSSSWNNNTIDILSSFLNNHNRSSSLIHHHTNYYSTTTTTTTNTNTNNINSNRINIPQRIVSRPTVFLYSNNVYRNPGSEKTKKKKYGSHGRGNKGYKARAGRDRPVPGFEGGQTGILKAFPKIGSSYKRMKYYTPVTMDQLQYWIDSGKIDASKKITVKTLFDAGFIRPDKSLRDGIELEETGIQHFTHKIDIEVQKTNVECIKKIEANGGSLLSVYYHKDDLHAMLHPERYIVRPDSVLLPKRANDIEYYTNPEFRGYLANASKEQMIEISKSLYGTH